MSEIEEEAPIEKSTKKITFKNILEKTVLNFIKRTNWLLILFQELLD